MTLLLTVWPTAQGNDRPFVGVGGWAPWSGAPVDSGGIPTCRLKSRGVGL